eukprot:symbB.v1.2.013612.t1/scaffold968.1/size148170/7
MSLLLMHLRNASSFFEFGTGTSTVYVAMKFPKLQVQAVELDEQWAGQVQTNLDQRQLPATVSHVNIGPTEAFEPKSVGVRLLSQSRTRVCAA